MNIEQVPVATVAKLLGVTTRRVQQLAADGVIRPDGRGRYDLTKVIPSYCADLRMRKTSSTDDRKRLEKARADMAEIDLAKARDELLSSDAVASTWADALVTLKTRLRSIPSKVAPVLAGEPNAATVHRVLLEAIDACLFELSEPEAWEHLSEADTGPEPAAAT